MIGPFVEAISYLYLKKPTITPKKNFYSVRISSKSACMNLLNTTKLGIHKWEVPFEFLTIKKYKIEWLRSFFDCEAYVSDKHIRVQSVNKEGLLNVQKLLLNLCIESKMYVYERKNKNWNTNYILSIHKKEDRRKFLDEIGFNHEVKLNRLKQQFS